MSLAQHPVVVLVFAQTECESCDLFMPRFIKIHQEKYKEIPVYLLDINAPENQGIADRLGVAYTPTVAVLRRSQPGAFKLDGDRPDDQIEYALNLARQVAKAGG